MHAHKGNALNMVPIPVLQYETSQTKYFLCCWFSGGVVDDCTPNDSRA